MSKEDAISHLCLVRKAYIEVKRESMIVVREIQKETVSLRPFQTLEIAQEAASFPSLR